ncbi:MAG: hypothetical protein NZR01_00485 [Bryobacteraceae bacterium]|nr:hypothetical protein [Bryobacteraceae bacterium]
MKLLALALLGGLLVHAADRTEWRGRAGDPKLSIDARLYIDREQMKALLGHDPGPSVVIVEVTLTPAAGAAVELDLDDFLLRSDRDGQRSRPLDPAQIAGSAVMVISSRGGTQGTGMAEERRVPWGVPGIPGGSPTGGPPRGIPLPGQSPNVGTATADTSEAVASVEENREKKSNPLLEALQARQLAAGRLDGPRTGLLYFLIEGKLRAKDLELVYRKAPPRLHIRFTDASKTKK